MKNKAIKKISRTELKIKAQDELMYGIATVLSADSNIEGILGDNVKRSDDYERVLKQQADRVAKLFGFDKAWYV